MATIPPSWQYPVTAPSVYENTRVQYLHKAVAEREQRYDSLRQMVKNQASLIKELTELKEDAEDEARRRLDQIRVLDKNLAQAESERDQLQGDVKSLIDDRDHNYNQLQERTADVADQRRHIERLQKQVRGLADFGKGYSDSLNHWLCELSNALNLPYSVDPEWASMIAEVKEHRHQLVLMTRDRDNWRADASKQSARVSQLESDLASWRGMASCNSHDKECQANTDFLLNTNAAVVWPRLWLLIDTLEGQITGHVAEARAEIGDDEQVDAAALGRFARANKAVVLRQVVRELRSLLQDRFEVEHVEEQYAVSYPSYGEQPEKPGFRFYIWGYGANPMSYRQLPDGSLQWWYEHGKGWRQSYLPSAKAHPLREVTADDLPDEGARAKAYSL